MCELYGLLCHVTLNVFDNSFTRPHSLSLSLNLHKSCFKSENCFLVFKHELKHVAGQIPMGADVVGYDPHGSFQLFKARLPGWKQDCGCTADWVDMCFQLIPLFLRQPFNFVDPAVIILIIISSIFIIIASSCWAIVSSSWSMSLVRSNNSFSAADSSFLASPLSLYGPFKLGVMSNCRSNDFTTRFRYE